MFSARKRAGIGGEASLHSAVDEQDV